MAGKQWNDDELRSLIEVYNTANKKTIMSRIPNRTWDSIKLKAASLGLSFYSSDKVHPSVKAELSVLLLDVPNSYYWAGFLSADGSFVDDRMALALAKKDKNHLELFAQYVKLNCNPENKGSVFSVRVKDKLNVPKIRNKFDLEDQKTYHPPDISFLAGNLFLAWFIGYIDGDGSIGYQSGGRKDCQLRIKVHNSWKSTLQVASNKLFALLHDEPRRVNIDSQGYALLGIAKQSVLRFLKEQALQMKLPVLSRKWDKIQLEK